MPEWGIEQRVTRGQNQTSPEWKLKWILRPIEANTLDFFFAERAKGGEWFRCTPPTGTAGRFRCDNWSKQVVACNIWEVEATIREVFSYDLPLIPPNVAVLSLSGLPTSFVYIRIFSANAGSLTLSGLPVGLFRTKPIHADKGTFILSGNAISTTRRWQMSADVGAFVLTMQPATLSGGDPNFANVSLLLHMDGSNNSTTFTDNSINAFTVTTFGDAKISTAQSKFGGASGFFDGIGDYLNISSDAAFDYGTSDFTVEFWYRSSTAPTLSPFRRILAHPSSTNAANTFQIWHASTATSGATIDAVELAAPTGTGVVCSVKTAVSDGLWHHIAFARQTGTSRAFLDGVLKQSAVDTNNYTRGGTEGIRIAARGDLAASTFVDGYIDDLRITKGVARYTETFTVPSTAFPSY